MKSFKSFITSFALGLVLASAAYSQTSLTTLDGSRLDVQAQNGKVVILAIGASWLPLSSKQADISNAIAKRYAGKDVVVYFVATDSSNAKSKNFASDDTLKKFAFDKKVNAIVLRDPDAAIVTRNFKIEQVPSFVVLDRSGHLAGLPFGGIDADPNPRFDLMGRISKLVDTLF